MNTKTVIDMNNKLVLRILVFINSSLANLLNKVVASDFEKCESGKVSIYASP